DRVHRLLAETHVIAEVEVARGIGDVDQVVPHPCAQGRIRLPRPRIEPAVDLHRVAAHDLAAERLGEVRGDFRLPRGGRSHDDEERRSRNGRHAYLRRGGLVALTATTRDAWVSSRESSGWNAKGARRGTRSRKAMRVSSGASAGRGPGRSPAGNGPRSRCGPAAPSGRTS